LTRDIFIWWLTAQGFGIVGLPLARFLFRALPDRGYAFGKALGLLLTGYLAWLLAMLGLAPFGRGLVLVCALAVGGAGVLLIRRTTNDERRGDPPEVQRGRWSFVAGWRSLAGGRWSLILSYEVIFALALVLVALLRSYNPDPWGTERPMDYALFNAIRRSPTFPPHDPWLAGYSINYYYFGYLLMAVVSLASGIEWGAAYNLSLALVFALAALGVAGVIWNLIALTTNDERRTMGEDRPSRGGRWPVVVGRFAVALLAIVLVLFAGNQGGALELITGSNMAVALGGRDLARAVANGLGPREPLALSQPFKGDYFDGTVAITPTNTLEGFNLVFHSWWWNPTRAVWDPRPDPNDPAAQPYKSYDITEFPFFSFLLGDMHPHVMALPFGLLALALALQTLARPAAPAFGMGRRGWAELALTGIVLGSLYFLNSWDLPTYVLLFLGALLLLYVRLGSPAGETSPARSAARSPLQAVWWRHYATQAGLALIAAWVLFAPFQLTFRSLVGGRGLPVGLVTWAKTPLYSFLIIFGLFLLPLAAFVFVQGQAVKKIEDRGSGIESGIVHRPSSTFYPLSSLSQLLPWVTLGALVVGVVAGFPLLALLPLAVYAIALAIERAGQPAQAFALWAFALGCLICFGTEIVYIRDVFDSRLNTIFKFYYQAWLIWGVLAAYALWWLFAGRRANDERPTTNEEQRTTNDQRPKFLVGPWSLVFGRWSLVVLAALFCLLLAGALAYPTVVLRYAFGQAQRVGLDGITPREQTPDGAAAVAWLRQNAPAGSVVLEAIGGGYDQPLGSYPGGMGAAGVSASTGLPTVLGWPGHEQQWRGGDAAVLAQLSPRQNDVATIYSSTDTLQAGELLKKYGVDYIYVGAAERATYPVEGLAKLAQLGDVAFQQGDVTIYRVRK
jgi:YYY domain-containing protein